jgi:hypothetical protein
LIVADITSLLAGGAKSLLKDKAEGFLSPSQMELARFAMSPQAYLADKGIAAAANLLGYGDQYRNLRYGAQAEKDYYKETMRDALGNMLPDAVGDVVRSTPRSTEADYDSSMEALRQSANTPEAAAQFNAGFNPDSQYNVGSPNYVGPHYPGSMDGMYGDNVRDLYEMLGQYQQPNDNSANSAPIDFGGMMDYGDTFGGGGSKPEQQLQAEGYKHGGQICGCKR